MLVSWLFIYNQSSAMGKITYQKEVMESSKFHLLIFYQS